MANAVIIFNNGGESGEKWPKVTKLLEKLESL